MRESLYAGKEKRNTTRSLRKHVSRPIVTCVQKWTGCRCARRRIATRIHKIFAYERPTTTWTTRTYSHILGTMRNFCWLCFGRVSFYQYRIPFPSPTTDRPRAAAAVATTGGGVSPASLRAGRSAKPDLRPPCHHDMPYKIARSSVLASPDSPPPPSRRPPDLGSSGLWTISIIIININGGGTCGCGGGGQDQVLVSVFCVSSPLFHFTRMSKMNGGASRDEGIRKELRQPRGKERLLGNKFRG